MTRIRTLRDRIGRRGSSLLFFGFLDLIYGYSLVYPDHYSRMSPAFAFYRDVMPMWGWATLWFGVGLTCLFHAFRRTDRWGFTAAIGLKVGWGLVSLGGWVFAGVERGWVAAAVWLAFAGWVWGVAGWSEPNSGEDLAWTGRRSS